MMHSSYTDRYSSDEHFDGDWDDIVSPDEYNDYIDRVQYAKSNAIVMHPGPMNRGVEIDGEIADDINRSVIQEQVEMGVAVRMAAMDLLARNLRGGPTPSEVTV